MAVITPFFDVVAGVAILAGRSSLLDTGVFKTANTNFTIRHILALGFIGVGVWNLWKIERAQDKLKKSLGAESYDFSWGDVKEMTDAKCPFCKKSSFRINNEEGYSFGLHEEELAGDFWLLECANCGAEWNQGGESTLDRIDLLGAEIWAEAVDWFDEQGSDNEGFPYGISYMAGPERGEIEWFSDEEERDMVLDTYIGEMEGELYTTDPETGMVVPMNAESFGAEAEIWAEAELYEADDEVYSVSIGYVGLGKDDGEQFAEKLFTLKESVVDRLEDEWKGVYYFDINDDSQKKPMSYKQITDILERGSFNAEGDSEAYVVWKLKGKLPNKDWEVIEVFNDRKDAVNASKNYSYGVFEELIGMEEDDERGAESFGAEPMFVESDSLMVELMGFDGSYRTDGEVKMGYTTAAELGFEPKELKPVMWVWDDIEGYGAFMPTEKIRFI